MGRTRKVDSREGLRFTMFGRDVSRVILGHCWREVRGKSGRGTLIRGSTQEETSSTREQPG